MKKKINGIDVKYAETEEVIAKMSVEEAIYFTTFMFVIKQYEPFQNF